MAKKSLPIDSMLESEDDFETAYKAYSKPIYWFFYWRTRNIELSEDLTSNVFEKAWRSRRNFQGGSIRAWLYRIARNLLIDHWRVKKHIPLENEDDLPDEAAGIGEKLDKQIVLGQLQQALGKLPDRMRSVVEIRFIEGLSAKQAADRLGLSESNVRVIQYRALKKMRGYLDEK